MPFVLSAEEYTNAVSKAFEKTVDRFASSARFKEHPATIALLTECLNGARDLCHKFILRVSILPSARAAYFVAHSTAVRLEKQFDQ